MATVNPHLLMHGQLISSPGCHFTYRVIGPCCQLFDREQLPWPCCRIQWHSKEPSWRRVGRRFVVDTATRGHPVYNVEIVGQGQTEAMILTLYWIKLPVALRDWWYSDRLRQLPDSPPLAVAHRSCSSLGDFPC